MSLERLTDDLGWPKKQWILDPPGAGAAVNAVLAQQKIRHSFRTSELDQDMDVGVLSLDPTADSTQAPLAVVCAFNQPATNSTLAKLHRLAWNFSRTPLLLTVDTHNVRAFTCCEPPPRTQDVPKVPSEIPEARYEFSHRPTDRSSLTRQAGKALHWLELTSGRFLQRHERRFRSNERADTLLLKNLAAVRKELHADKLDYDVIHDLLARTIFVQFLFHRRDTDGYTALNTHRLHELYQKNVLLETYDNLGEILLSHTDTYRFFWHLDAHFNGDLFPGQNTTIEDRQRQRNAESRRVSPEHLRFLSEFVTGKMEIDSGQYSLWPEYSFDVIPLEFISSIYESFVQKATGTVYTPAHLVDFVLDGILPWADTDWNLQILDPACGSGIFLVKAFQRLVHRWKRAHPEKKIDAAVLRSLLSNNLFGVDVNAHAVRVASFSLYLAMCDEIEPRYYWSQVRFPTLRGTRLVSEDFFSENCTGIRTKHDAQSYDLVLGNAPFGRNSIRNSSGAERWAQANNWPVAYGDIGPLFLGKASSLVKAKGHVSLLQSANTILFYTSTNSRKLRERLFLENQVAEVVNFSALRFGLFRKALGPSALITLAPTTSQNPDTGEFITYISPKPTQASGSDDYRISVDPYDIHLVHRREAASGTRQWIALMWGGRRDLALLDAFDSLPTLENYEREGKVRKRLGIIRGDRKKKQEGIVGRRMLMEPKFPDGTFVQLGADLLPINTDPMTDGKASTDLSAFEPLQLLMKTSWTKANGRFRAAIVDAPDLGVLCTQSFVSVQADRDLRSLLERACVSFNSEFAVYFLLLSSGRFASYRPSPKPEELLSVPIIDVDISRADGLKSFSDLDSYVWDVLNLQSNNKVLIEDALRYTLPDFKGGLNSPGRLPTRRLRGEEEGTTEVHSYCEWFLRVLRSGFGEKRSVSATVFEEPVGESDLPVRMVAIHMNAVEGVEVRVEEIQSELLLNRLKDVYQLLHQDKGDGFLFQRVARVFDMWKVGGREIPTLFIVKVDRARYWTRSVALRDADDASVEIMQRITEDGGR